jgi:UDP-sugar transporter A1/2/3
MFVVFQDSSSRNSSFAFEGIFDGFTPLTWLIISLQVSCGFLVALVLKQSDNIIKNFGSTISIVVTSILDYFILDSHLSFQFSVGAMIILISLTSYQDARKAVDGEVSELQVDTKKIELV